VSIVDLELPVDAALLVVAGAGPPKSPAKTILGLGEVAGKFWFGIGAKLLPISRFLAATPV
jgi:hypothetical protein